MSIAVVLSWVLTILGMCCWSRCRPKADILVEATFVTIGFWLFFAVLVAGCAEKTWVLKSSHPLHAVDTIVSTQGSFFLGSGIIQGKVAYFAMVEEDNGLFVWQVPADDMVIKFDPKPHVDTYQQQYANPIWRSFPKDIKEFYFFYIPENRVISEYNLTPGAKP